ncbi:MAG: DNA polymerase III subunit delta' [Rhodobacteraceae bacterium]|nr:DNA polymerase III subunit delta' [Paracoccaceae bacterium]
MSTGAGGEAGAEADRAEGTPHPRHAPALHGQGPAEAAFLAAHAGGRLPHGWLITGPRGVGKATLAWRIARFLLAAPAAGDDRGLLAPPPPPLSLDVAPDHPTARRVAALTEPRLKLLRRGWDDDRGRLRAVITVDEVRELLRFLALSAADGGRRVVIVDAADDLNPAAANALLKILEEPPEGAVLLLVSHQPAALLPTIRSRCRVLRCAPLGSADLARALAGAGVEPPAEMAALVELSRGSAGAAVALTAGEGLALYGRIVALFAGMPRLDRPAALALAETAGRDPRAFELVLDLVETFLARLARTGATGRPPAAEAAPGEARILARLAPDVAAARAWAARPPAFLARARAGRAVNLDPAALLVDMLLALNEGAAR